MVRFFKPVVESMGAEEELGSGDVVGLMEHHIDVPRGPLGLPGQGSYPGAAVCCNSVSLGQSTHSADNHIKGHSLMSGLNLHLERIRFKVAANLFRMVLLQSLRTSTLICKP